MGDFAHNHKTYSFWIFGIAKDISLGLNSFIRSPKQIQLYLAFISVCIILKFNCAWEGVVTSI